jgi:hypothetical protein
VVAALRDLEPLLVSLAGDPIDQTMLAIDPSRPPALPVLAKRLRLAESFEWGAHAILDQRIYAPGDFRVIRLPVQIFFPAAGREADLTAA